MFPYPGQTSAIKMSTLQELKTAGEELGLSGPELRDFIRDTQAEERNLRAAEREQEKLRLDNERVRLENERLREKENHDHVIALKQLELKEKLATYKPHPGQADESDNDNDDDDDDDDVIPVHSNRANIRTPKLPYFDETSDCMDSYLYRFEQFALAQGWRQNDMAIYLSALLRGKALEVYSRMPPDQSRDYVTLKRALLRRYQLTEEGFKAKFRTAKPDNNESPAQFIVRIDNYLQRWIELSAVPQTFVGLKSLFVKEQYINSCPTDLAVFLKERAPADLATLGDLAQQYLDAHQSSTPRNRVSNKPDNDPAQKKCYICGGTNHLARYCKQAETSNPRTNNERPVRKCYNCGKPGHISKNCFARVKPAASCVCDVHTTGDSDDQPNNSNECLALQGQQCIQLKCGCILPVIADACRQKPANPNMPLVSGRLNNQEITVLRDTGCSSVVVRRSLVQDSELTGKKEMCVLIDGTVRHFPVAYIEVDTPFFSGSTKALCMNKPVYDLIIGNIDGATTSVTSKPETSNKSESVEHVPKTGDTIAAVVTRSQALKPKEKPLKVADIAGCDVDSTKIQQMQRDDETLKSSFDKTDHNTSSDDTIQFSIIRGLLHRIPRRGSPQLATPNPLRNQVMQLAHDGIMSGHQGIRRTTDRVLSNFWWPGLQGDVTRFCRSCDICQRTVHKGKIPKAPLTKVPIIQTPFTRVAIDLIGPMFPSTDRGHRYILTLVDYATRYPEATPLKNIETETVAEALVTMFSRIGVPQEVLSDQGSQFLSGIMKEVSRLLSIRQLITSPYHPQCNGLVERFNGTLKEMIKRMCAEKPRDWDRYVAPLLFAYREVPQESLAFSPFELIYGRTVRGPMQILKELWSKEIPSDETKTTYQYVLDLKNRLQDTCQIAHENLRKAQNTQKKYFDCKAKDRQFEIGDKVLLLLPTANSKLLLQWKGPFEVLQRNGNDYQIQLADRKSTVHVNMLKKYFERTDDKNTSTEIAAFLDNEALAAIIEPENENEEGTTPLQLVRENQSETYKDVLISSHLNESQQQQARSLIYEFKDIFTDVPRITTLGEHTIALTTDEPVRTKMYSLPYAMKQVFDNELDTMLRMNIIEPSTANYTSGVVLVKKPDGSTRVCIDYRKLNTITMFDLEPMPNAEDIFVKLTGDRFFSKFDLSKGYWQVPMKPEHKDYTTFICHRGLFKFNVMPFGLINAPATFSRLMRRLLAASDCLDNLLDDVLAHTQNWNDHLTILRDFFQRCRKANLVLRPTKCSIGDSEITFLGHRVSSEGLKPKLDSVDKILETSIPTTKKQVRSFLGLIGFYRKYIPNFAAIASPLTDLTRKGSPNEVEWSDIQQKAFDALKAIIASPPILKLPDFNHVFILQTDASNVGIGAMLLQEENGTKHPIAFASRKLLPRETRYSTIEKECLRIVWSITKFQDYLYGKEFILETDHQPLQYLKSTKYQNGRVMRWTLALQPYRFVVKAIHGRDNVGADFLSRNPI